ncbi:MAG: HU family DNA-binding protein [Bdellovibrionales bacterium]|nr:HU family DNA-binding protein [Bdellovibrionales bacterium]
MKKYYLAYLGLLSICITPGSSSAATAKSVAEVVAQQAGIPEAQAGEESKRVFEAIEAALRSGQEVQVRSFGTFYVQSRAARQGKNPKTGEQLQIPAKRYPRFRSSDLLKASLNGNEGQGVQ